MADVFAALENVVAQVAAGKNPLPGKAGDGAAQSLSFGAVLARRQASEDSTLAADAAEAAILAVAAEAANAGARPVPAGVAAAHIGRELAAASMPGGGASRSSSGAPQPAPVLAQALAAAAPGAPLTPRLVDVSVDEGVDEGEAASQTSDEADLAVEPEAATAAGMPARAIADAVSVAPAMIVDQRGKPAQTSAERAEPPLKRVSKGLVAADAVAATPARGGQALPVAADARALPEAVLAATGSAPQTQALAAVAAQVSGAAGVTRQGAESEILQGILARAAEQSPRAPESRLHLALEAPVRGAAFAAELSDKLVWLAGRQGQWAALSLNPPHMGSLEVRLTLSGGEAGAQFFSANPAVRDALEAALPRLRELMAGAGINLGEAQVREEAFSRREDAAGYAQRPGMTPVETAFPLDGMVAGSVRSGGLGLVDLYV